MNTIKCPNCRFENTFGLVFCTNCGASLYGQQNDKSTATIERKPVLSDQTLEYQASSGASQKKSGSSRLLIFGGIAAVLLLLFGAVALSALFYYLGSRNKTVANTANYNTNTNVNTASIPNKNISTSNTTTANTNTKANTNTEANKTDDPDFDDTDIELNPFTLPPAVGEYEQQGSVVGNAADDFPGADEISKATYVKKGKEVELILAKFSSRDGVKSGYDDFLKGFRSSGAKVLARQKVKNKAGVYNGEASLFTFEKKWNALLYTERYAVRLITPDRYSLLEFAKEFEKLFSNN
jgi:hypothetical protein